MTDDWSLEDKSIYFCGCCQKFHPDDQHDKSPEEAKILYYEGELWKLKDIETLRQKLIDDFKHQAFESGTIEIQDYEAEEIINKRFGFVEGKK